MGIPERKEREKNHRRSAILKAAKDIILQSGVEGMSMNQLAESTELNKATLYLYYRNKDDLVDAIVFEGLVLLEKKLKEATQLHSSGLDKVLGSIHTIFVFYKQYPVYFYTLNHQERRKVNERLETPYSIKGHETASRIFEKIAEGLRQGMAEGSIRKEIDVDRLLILLFAHTYGVTHTVYSKKDVYKDVFDLEPEIIEESALDMIAYYLKTRN